MSCWRLCRVPAVRLQRRCISAISSRLLHEKKPADGAREEPDPAQPLKFSTSKGSHRSWTVDKSFGSEHQRPWWKVLPVSLAISALLIWAAFRKETELDAIIYRPISELLEEMEKDKEESGKGVER